MHQESEPPKLELKSVLISLGATGFAALLVFLVFPLTWNLISKTFPKLDWKTIFLILFLVLYFRMGIYLLPQEIKKVGELRREIKSKAAYLALIPAFLKPGIKAIKEVLFLLSLPLALVLEKILHKDQLKILSRSIGAFAIIWTSIYSVLIFANLWHSSEKQCAWVFPKILTCVLVNYEGLAGGLIGAGGTVFAGWLAWTAVQEQIRSGDK